MAENKRVKVRGQITYSSAGKEVIQSKLPAPSLKLFHKYCLNNLLDMQTFTPLLEMWELMQSE